MSTIATRSFFAACVALAGALAGPSSAQGLLFAATNDPQANQVVVFGRLATGQLSLLTTVATQGTGTGAGLGSQGALVLSPDNQWLITVNAGSDDVTVFHVTPAGLVLTDVQPSGGTKPISVTVQNGRVYVLNAGTPNNVTGFDLSINGTLSPISGAVHALSAASTDPAQVQLSPLGDRLIVTEKATNLIDSLTVNGDGSLQGFAANPSAGQTPFGFGFQGTDHLIVSEAFNMAPDGSAVSSYQMNGGLSVISPSVPTTETAACWIAITRDGRFAYTTNTGSDSITGYAISATGQLSLLNANGVTASTGDAPTDMAFTWRTRFLYVLNSNVGSVSGYERNASGALTLIQAPTGGLPPGATGLAVL